MGYANINKKQPITKPEREVKVAKPKEEELPKSVVLREGEKVIKISHPSKITRWGLYGLGGIFGFFALGGVLNILILGFEASPVTILMGILVFVMIGSGNLSVKSDMAILTTHRVIHKRGIFSLHQSEVRIKDIRSVNIRQGIIQRLLGYGGFDICTAGDVPEISVRGIPDFAEFAEAINAQRPE